MSHTAQSNVPEPMIWPWTATASHGITRNPWNAPRTTGGSSGGSAASDPDYGLALLEFAQAWVRGVYDDSLRVPDRRLLERSSRGMASAGRGACP